MKKTLMEILSQKDEKGETVKEAIARSITEKATNGDLNAIKFLRDIADEDEGFEVQEIKITVID